jgi:autotransporter-associated beta strand protein
MFRFPPSFLERKKTTYPALSLFGSASDHNRSRASFIAALLTAKRLHDPILSSRAFAIFFIVTILIAITLLLAPKAQATTRTKANNTTNLNLTGSWSGGVVPGSTDIALWNNTVTGANTVLLGANLNFGEMQITNPGGLVTINAGNTLTLSGVSGTGIDMSTATQNLTLNCAITLGGAQSWNIGSGRTLTLGGSAAVNNGGFLLTITGAGNTSIGTVISGAGGLTKTGAGTLTLTAANTFTGGITVNGGTLTLDHNAAGAATSNIIPNGGDTLTLAGGTFSVNGNATTNGSDTVNGLTLNSGASAITIIQTTNIHTALTLGAITRNTGSTINFTNPTSTTNLDATHGINTSTAVVNGILGAYATVVNNVGAIDWAMKGGGGGNAITNFTPYTTFVATGGVSTTNYLQTGTLALTGNVVGNSLKITTTGAGQSLDIGATRTLTLTSGGLLFVGANDYSITNGTLKSNTATNSELIVQQWGTGKLTIGSVIADGNGASTLTKAGTGTLILTGANTYTGATTVNAGTLSLDNAGTTSARLVNTSNITLNSGGTLLLASSSGSSTDRINNSATVTLNGGTFNTGALSEGTTAAAGVGALTLQASSNIDFGAAVTNSILHFAASNLATWTSGKILEIDNWSGLTSGGGIDQLIFGTTSSGLTASQIAEIQFLNPAGFAAGTYGATILSNGEIVPIPEPSTWLAAALALGAIGYGQRKRIGTMLRARMEAGR